MDLNNVSSYDLGIIWALGSKVEDKRYSFRYKERYFLERLCLYFGNTIYQQNRSSKDNDRQFVLKVRGIDTNKLHELGWTERNSDIRNIPILSNYKDFLRSYIEIHSSLDYSTRYRKNGEKYKALRLRIYGNVVLMGSMNKILHENAKVDIKTVQTLKNNKTSILYYTSISEIESIFDYLYDVPCFDVFWNDVREKMKNPTKDYI